MTDGVAHRNSVLLQRQRLHQQIQRSLPHHAVWLVAAGGYGKTTLAGGFIEHTAAPALTLTLAQPGGPGEFFYVLREQAIHVFGDSAVQLPLLAPENSAAPDRFARHFATRLTQLAPGGALLFLDDLHHLPADDPMQTILCHLVDVLLDNGMGVLMASRHEPAPAWIRLRSQGRLTFIGEPELAFTPRERTSLMQSFGLGDTADDDSPPLQVAGLEGWAAGLMLCVEHRKRHGGAGDERLLQRSLDDWFRAEIFDPLAPADQALLYRCAWVRQIPESVVAEVTEDAGAADRLRRLHLHHAFLRSETDTQLGHTYRLHDLFRDFLCQQAEQDWPEEQVTYWKNRWGRRLWEVGHWSEGARLLTETRDYDTLAQGLREQAAMLVQTGRGDQLFHWLQALPADLRDNDPHLCLWQGLCLTLVDTTLARQIMAGAWQALSARKDYVHMAIAWGGIVDSIWLEWAHVSEYEPWVDALLAVEDELRAQLPQALWFRVLRGMLTALGYSRPWDPDLERWQREAMSALSTDAPDDERVMMASQLMYLNTWQFGRRAEAAHVMRVMRESPDVIERASPLSQCLWRTFTSLWALLFEGDREACLREAEAGRDLIRRHGISTWDNAVPPIHAAACFMDKTSMDNWIDWFMRTDLKAHRPFYDTFQPHFLCVQAWLDGHGQEALNHAERAVVAMEKHGSIAISAGFGAVYAALLSENGRHGAALREAARARGIHCRFDSAFVDQMLYLNLARIPLLRGQPRRALPSLRRFLRTGARERMFFPLMIRDDELAALCGLALANDLETDYVHWLIRMRDLPPPTSVPVRQRWPWPCRIHVLGRFDIELFDAGQARVSQRKSRALLSNLILAGPDGLPLERLAAELWPDSPPEKAMNSLHVTVHRVRDLLRDPSALCVDGGLARLNRGRVWLDAWELADLAARAGCLETPTLREAVALYRGRLQLSDIDDTDLAIQEEALNRTYRTLVLTLGQRLETQTPDEALAYYRQGLRYLPLESGFWAGVLRCEAELGNRRALELSFQQARRLYSEELDIDVPNELSELYLSLT